ncbi:MAG: penicillin-binding protein [Deltaproteobacteria bacterium]|nr:MAG: penicillin-binding protein [Deltaproteobacteria bacterium]
MPDRKATRWMRLRLGIVCGVLLLFAGTLAWRMWTLQVRRAEWLRDLSRQQVLKEITLEPLRGPILDRNGAPLAISIMAESIYAMPRQLEDAAAAARALARALEMDPQQSRRLVKRLSTRKYFTWVKRRVSDRLARQVRRLDIKGVGFTRESRRYYPARELAANLIGFVGDGRGLEGVELLFDDRLRGSEVVLQGLRDAHGRLVFPEGTREPDSGGTVVLTIDANIQEIVERELERGWHQAQARAATAVVMDPHSGEILAMASLPSYNPNVYWQSRPAQRRNRAVTDCYEPGSTMKVFTMAAALQGQLVRPEETIDCQGGALVLGSHTIHDAHRGLRRLTASEVLVHSSNVGMAIIGARLGREGLYQALHEFGFGRKTGVDLPGEVRCRLRPPARWSDVGLATISFGQGVSVTALQLLAALNSVANGGVWLRPQIVRAIRDSSGRTIDEGRPDPQGRVMSREVAAELTRMMVRVVQPGGTGTRAALDGFTVAGKTGTAQKVDPVAGGYSEHLRVASFMGFVPAEQPRLSILVVMDEPQSSPYGGVVAAPVFARIAAAVLNYQGVFSSRPAVARPRPDPAPGEEPVVETALIVEEAEAVAGSSAEVAAGRVPDVRGLSARAALRRLWERGYEVVLNGFGRVARQRPAPGSRLPRQAVVRLELQTRRRPSAGGQG